MNTSISSLTTFQYTPLSKPLFNCASVSSSMGSRKPKLSLNTTCQPRTLGRGSTGLRLDTLNVTSPTSQNTYRNVYDSPISTPSLESDSGSASTPFPRLNPSKHRSSIFGAAAPTTPMSPSADSDPASLLSPTLPYEQPANLRSILRNRSGSSRKKLRPRRLQACFASMPASSNPTTTSSFSFPSTTSDETVSPPGKRVCFQQPLCTDIETSVYVLRHSDLPSRSPSPSPIIFSAASQDDDDEYDEEAQRPGSSSSSMSLSSAATNDSSADSSPATPVANVANSFRKREREWVWTLGPINRVDSSNNEEEVEEEQPASKKSMLDVDLITREH